MKKRYAWIVSIGLVLALVFFALLSRSMRTSKEAPLPDKVLRVAMWNDSTTVYDRMVIDAFRKLRPDIEVNIVTFSPQNYVEGLEALLYGQQQIDVFYMIQLTQYASLVEKEVLKPLDFSLSQSELAHADLLGLDNLRNPEDGSLYALPYRLEKGFLYYNKTLFDSLSVPYPAAGTTWAEFEEIAGALQRGIEQQGVDATAVMLLPDSVELVPLLSAQSYKDLLDDPHALKPGLEMISRLEQKGSLASMYESWEKGCSQKTFETGNYGMFVTGSDFARTLIEDGRRERFGFEWGVTAAPVWNESGGNAGLTKLTPVGIYRHTMQPRAAWDFLSFLCSSQAADILSKNLLISTNRQHTGDAGFGNEYAAQGLHQELYAKLDIDGFMRCPETKESAQWLDLYEKYMNVVLGLMKLKPVFVGAG